MLLIFQYVVRNALRLDFFKIAAKIQQIFYMCKFNYSFDSDERMKP